MLAPIMAERAFAPGNDPYLLMLREQYRTLKAREAELDAREKQLEADREAVAEDRARLDVARQHYEAFLASQPPQTAAQMKFYGGGEQLPLTDEQRSALYADFKGPPTAPIPLPMRMGAKRRRVLDAVATGNGLTTREIADKTGVDVDVVRNITAAETKAGIFARQGDKLYMTPAGLDYLNRANAHFGPPQKETPPTAASGVFQ